LKTSPKIKTKLSGADSSSDGTIIDCTSSFIRNLWLIFKSDHLLLIPNCQ